MKNIFSIMLALAILLPVWAFGASLTPVTEEGTAATLTVTALTVSIATIDTAIISTAQTTDTAISAVSITTSGAGAFNGGITVDSTAFIVADTSGNVTTAGTLTVAGESTFNAHVNLGAGDDLVGSSTSDINMENFDVAGATGNTTIGGTCGITGNTTVGGTFGVTGNTTLTGTLTANGSITLGSGDDLIGSCTSDINIDSVFTVDGATGNTVVGGTLGVTGATTFTGAITANSSITLGAGDDLIGSSTSDIDIDSVFTVAGATGNTLIAGTAEITGTLTQTGIATFAATAVFSGGQTKKEQLTGTQVTVDGTDGPSLGVIGTTVQSQANVWGFDANPNTGGDDWVFLRWAVPDGYVVGSARLNIIYSYSTAETDGDEIVFDFTADALTPGTAAAGGTVYDQAGTAGDLVTEVLTNGLGDEGKLFALQINIEGTAETFAVDDVMVIGFFVDEDSCDLAASGTVDIHSFEIEWESTE